MIATFRQLITFSTRAGRLAFGCCGLLFMLGGCAVSQSPDATQQFNDAVHAAYLRTASAGPLATTVRILVESGTNPIATAEGTATLDLARAAGEAKLTLYPGGPMTVVSRMNYLFEGHQPAGAKTGIQWITINAMRDAQTNPAQLPEIQEPGIDPLQIPAFLNAIRWPATIAGERPVLIDDTSGRHTDYEITVDTARLAALLPRPARDWLSLMAREPGGKYITLDITIDNGQISSVTGDLPVPPLRLPEHRKQMKAPATMPLHAVVGIQFQYGKHAASIASPG